MVGSRMVFGDWMDGIKMWKILNWPWSIARIDGKVNILKYVYWFLAYSKRKNSVSLWTTLFDCFQWIRLLERIGTWLRQDSSWLSDRWPRAIPVPSPTRSARFRPGRPWHILLVTRNRWRVWYEGSSRNDFSWYSVWWKLFLRYLSASWFTSLWDLEWWSFRVSDWQ